MLLSVRDERKQRRELLLRKEPQAGRHKKLPIVIDGLKFELDTQLTVSCVVAVASAYSLVTISIAIDSVL